MACVACPDISLTLLILPVVAPGFGLIVEGDCLTLPLDTMGTDDVLVIVAVGTEGLKK